MFRTNHGGEPPSQNAGRGVWWYLAAGFVGCVGLALVLVLTVGGGTGQQPSPQPPPAAAGGTTTAHRAGSNSNRPPGCHTTATDQTVPRSPRQIPDNITWHLVNGTAYPTSPTAGPMLHEGAATYCYAHTPIGALLAAWNIPKRTDGGPNRAQEMAQVAEHSWVPNQYAQQALEMVRNENAAQAGGGSTDSGQLAGFRFVSYTPEMATIALAVQFAEHQGKYQVQTVVLRWYQGDWRYVMQPGPQLAATVYVTDSLANFVPFSGVS